MLPLNRLFREFQYSTAPSGKHAAQADRQQLKSWLSDHGSAGPVTLRADRIVLVAQGHDGRHIMWVRLAEVPPGGAA